MTDFWFNDEVNRAYRELCRDAEPVRAIIGAPSLVIPGTLLEIEAGFVV
ncbi:MAG: hypothetical protein V3U79_02470 [Dehalococcoidia bacterium]